MRPPPSNTSLPAGSTPLTLDPVAESSAGCRASPRRSRAQPEFRSYIDVREYRGIRRKRSGGLGEVFGSAGSVSRRTHAGAAQPVAVDDATPLFAACRRTYLARASSS